VAIHKTDMQPLVHKDLLRQNDC